MIVQRIHPLPPMVANQISAGEVIERPASVVKELLENAYDAGATAIHVEIVYGGLNQIKISDNGSGIVADDLPLAVLAHATSKIRVLNDLTAIKSLGFRGEALASIAAVSRFSISSKPESQKNAMMLTLEGGAEPILSPCARGLGTTIEVTDLFFNAPVRKKFLKSAQGEFQAIERVVKRFALSANSVMITLKHNGKEILNLPPMIGEHTRSARIRTLFGKSFMDQAINLEVQHEGMGMNGWVCGPAYQRSQNDKQWIYLNQRMIHDKLINHAVKQAYQACLHPGRYPTCLLYLTVPPECVDVNVHPTKHEVRFQQPRLVHDFIISQLARVLDSVSEIRVDFSDPPQKSPLPSVSSHATHQELFHVLNPQFGLVFVKNTAYLVDLLKLHANSLRDQLVLPLSARPLLVGLNYPLSFHAEWVSILNLVGIQVEWVGQNEVKILTIPENIGQLDLKIFFHKLKDTDPTILGKEALLSALIQCNLFNAQTLSSSEKSVLMDAFMQQLPFSPSPHAIQLDQAACQNILQSFV